MFWDIQREWHDRMDAFARGYAAEARAFCEDNPQPTFKRFLLAKRSTLTMADDDECRFCGEGNCEDEACRNEPDEPTDDAVFH
jgi:hypothetical protein